MTFKMYVDMVSFITRRFLPPGWTEVKFIELYDDIKELKSHASTVLASFPASIMGTSEWQSLDYVVESLSHVSGIENFNDGIYE